MYERSRRTRRLRRISADVVATAFHYDLFQAGNPAYWPQFPQGRSMTDAQTISRDRAFVQCPDNTMQYT